MAAPLLLAAIGAGALKAFTNPEVAGGVAQGLMSAFDPNAKEYRRQIRDARKRLKKDDFGLSEAEKNSAMSSVTRQQQAAARGATDEIRRQGAAMGGRTAASAEAMRGVASDLAGQAAAARGGLEAESAKLANQQREAAKALINNRRQELSGMADKAGRTTAKAASEFEKGFKSMKGAQTDYENLAPEIMGKFKGAGGYAASKTNLTSEAEAEAKRLALQEEWQRWQYAGGTL